ncbi:hypothetical protein ACPCYY_21315, partial [Bacillus pumilus]|uniref:hypothetical protein n=1 Tax=Bacillus pumilus TaxID=1408 RepID=UPI003C14E218
DVGTTSRQKAGDLSQPIQTTSDMPEKRSNRLSTGRIGASYSYTCTFRSVNSDEPAHSAAGKGICFHSVNRPPLSVDLSKR